jgi:hypothetical protein
MQQGCDGDATAPEPSPTTRRFLTVAARSRRRACAGHAAEEQPEGGPQAMNNIIYIVGLVVVVLAILSFLGLR